MIKMMESEWFPLLTILPVGGTIFSHIGLCPNHIDSFEIFNFIFGVDAGIILIFLLSVSGPRSHPIISGTSKNPPGMVFKPPGEVPEAVFG